MKDRLLADREVSILEAVGFKLAEAYIELYRETLRSCVLSELGEEGIEIALNRRGQLLAQRVGEFLFLANLGQQVGVARIEMGEEAVFERAHLRNLKFVEIAFVGGK